jgi:peptidoglycan/LPS O-acetylase OafA/YrhL
MPALQRLALVPVVLAVATLSYFLLEKPLQAKGRQWFAAMRLHAGSRS